MPDEEETPDDTGEKDDEDEKKMEQDEVQTVSLFEDSDDSPYVDREVFIHVVTNFNQAIMNLGSAMTTLNEKLEKVTKKEGISVRIRIAGQIEVFLRGDSKDKRWLMNSANNQTMTLIETLGLEDIAIEETEETYDPNVL